MAPLADLCWSGVPDAGSPYVRQEMSGEERRASGHCLIAATTPQEVQSPPSRSNPEKATVQCAAAEP